jgi:predicted transcriptional regulator of viral defense system
VTVEDVASSLELPKDKAAQVLARWCAQGWIKRLRRGVYAPVPLESAPTDSTLSRPWVLVPVLFDPAYVGGWSAAEHWHLTEQIFRDTCVFTSRDPRRRRVGVEGTTFVLRQTTRFFGLSSIWEGRVKIPISDPLRTVIDMINDPGAGGGMRHVEDCLANYLAMADADPTQLLDYARQASNGAIYKRLGFLLERSKHATTQIMDACKAGMTRGNAALDPRLPRERLITRWRLWVPASWAGAAR